MRHTCQTDGSEFRNAPMSKYDLLVVCGPTASGKTSLAVYLAAQCNAEIISADSRQLYRSLDIGSGKDLHEYSTGNTPVPYHLINIADPLTVYTLYHFQHDFRVAFTDITSRSRLPLLCGGSGLYIEAVLRNYAIPEVPENPHLRSTLMTHPIDKLKEMLYSLSQARYHQTDLKSKKRIVRAIEVASASGTTKPPAAPAQYLPRNPLILCTRWNRAELHERITRRLQARFDEGMIDEVCHLREKGLPDSRLLMLGMEYKYITLYLRGEMTLPDMTCALRHSIFQLAKRQETYFRGMERRCGVPVHWIDNADTATALYAARDILPCSSV